MHSIRHWIIDIKHHRSEKRSSVNGCYGSLQRLGQCKFSVSRVLLVCHAILVKIHGFYMKMRHTFLLFSLGYWSNRRTLSRFTGSGVKEGCNSRSFCGYFGERRSGCYKFTGGEKNSSFIAIWSRQEAQEYEGGWRAQQKTRTRSSQRPMYDSGGRETEGAHGAGGGEPQRRYPRQLDLE